MGLHTDRYIKISGWSTIDAIFSFSCNSDALAVIDAGRNGDIDFPMFFHTTFPMTSRTFFTDDLAFSTTIRTNTAIDHSAKRCALFLIQLTGAMTMPTSFRTRSEE